MTSDLHRIIKKRIVGSTKRDDILSDNNPCFQCNIAITIFILSHERVR